MIWEALGMIDGKTLLIAIIVAVVAFLVTIRPGKEDK